MSACAKRHSVTLDDMVPLKRDCVVLVALVLGEDLDEDIPYEESYFHRNSKKYPQSWGDEKDPPTRLMPLTVKCLKLVNCGPQGSTVPTNPDAVVGFGL